MTTQNGQADATVKTALIIADLIGVSGADTISSLAHGRTLWKRACEELTSELNVVITTLVNQGYSKVRVSDTHTNGSTEPNVIVEQLHPAAEVYRARDPYAAKLFEGVSVLALLGMHSGGGANGFMSHTSDVHVAWLEGERLLSEADLVMRLAAEHNVPVLFVAGDDLLIDSLRPSGVTCVVTKKSLSTTKARSTPAANVARMLEAAVSGPTVKARGATATTIELHFKSPNIRVPQYAPLAAQRTGPHTVLVEGATFRARYSAALKVLDVVQGATTDWITASIDSAEFLPQLKLLLEAPWPSLPEHTAP